MFSDQESGVTTERRGSVLRVLLDRPARKNSLTPDAVRVRKKELATNKRERRKDAIEEAQAVE